MGWFTVVAYFATAWLSMRAMRCVPRVAPSAHGRAALIYWFGLFVALLALGINKQLDLQTLFTELARKLLWLIGEYQERRLYQLLFILVLASVGVSLTWRAARIMRGHHRALIRSLYGVALLITFVIVRAASFHTFDQLLGVRLLGLKANWILELGALAIIAWGALGYTRAGRLG